MDWIQAIADLLGAIAWPAVALAAVILLRREIAGVMRRRITLRRGETSVEIAATALERRVEVAASALGAATEPQPDDDSASAAASPEQRQALVQDLLTAATQLGWTAAASGESRPPRPALDWTKEGARLLRGDLTDPHEWEMVKARLAVRIEQGLLEGDLTPEEADILVDMVKSARDQARSKSSEL